MGCKPVDKPRIKHKKGLWSPDEDQKLRNYIVKNGHACWSSVPINAGLQRHGKSCRLRWINYLRPGLKKGTFSTEEEEIILTLHQMLGNKWSQIAQHLPGRTDNEIKNYWHSYLKKKKAKIYESTETQAKPESTGLEMENVNSSSSPKSITQNSLDSFEHMEGSLMDTDQSTKQKNPAQNFNLPKILFAEWFSIDQFYGKDLQNSGSFKNTFNNPSTSFQDDESVLGLLLDDQIVGREMHTKPNNYSVDDIFFPPFDQDQVLERGLDYFPGEFSMSCDEMYI